MRFQSDFRRCVSVSDFKVSFTHSQRDTQRQHQIQSDGGASERLSRTHAATSRAGTQRTTKCDCLEGEMMDLHSSCFRIGKTNARLGYYCR